MTSSFTDLYYILPQIICKQEHCNKKLHMYARQSVTKCDLHTAYTKPHFIHIRSYLGKILN